MSTGKVTKLTISEESARSQMDIFFDYYEIDSANVGGGENAQDIFESTVDRLVDAIRKGRVEIVENEDGLIVKQTLKTVKKVGENQVSILEYKEISGAAKDAMKHKKETDHYGRIHAMLGNLSGAGEAAIRSLRGVDMSISECIGVLFLKV
jgi:Mg2+ and Co2+ transporter CorA